MSSLSWTLRNWACLGRVYSVFRSLRCCLVKKLRLEFSPLLSKAAKKLRLSQAQAKKRVQKLRLSFSPTQWAQFLGTLGWKKQIAPKIISGGFGEGCKRQRAWSKQSNLGWRHPGWRAAGTECAGHINNVPTPLWIINRDKAAGVALFVHIVTCPPQETEGCWGNSIPSPCYPLMLHAHICFLSFTWAGCLESLKKSMSDIVFSSLFQIFNKHEQVHLMSYRLNTYVQKTQHKHYIVE